MSARRRARCGRAASARRESARCPSRAGRRRPRRCRRTCRAARRRARAPSPREAITSAAAPSLIPDALPAVTVPPARNAGFSDASFSSVVSGRGCSSRTTSPTGTSSSSKRPASAAAAQRCCDCERERVLLLARDAPAVGDVLAGLAHRLEREELRQLRVDEAPAERRVVERAVAARERRLRLRHDERRAASSTRRRPRRRGRRRRATTAWQADDDGCEAGGAEPVHGHARDASRAARRAARPSARRCGCPRRPGSPQPK